jgi:hypothetical protein
MVAGNPHQGGNMLHRAPLAPNSLCPRQTQAHKNHVGVRTGALTRMVLMSVVMVMIAGVRMLVTVIIVIVVPVVIVARVHVRARTMSVRDGQLKKRTSAG